jgi:hypothetical protein
MSLHEPSSSRSGLSRSRFGKSNRIAPDGMKSCLLLKVYTHTPSVPTFQKAPNALAASICSAAQYSVIA